MDEKSAAPCKRAFRMADHKTLCRYLKIISFRQISCTRMLCEVYLYTLVYEIILYIVSTCTSLCTSLVVYYWTRVFKPDLKSRQLSQPNSIGCSKQNTDCRKNYFLCNAAANIFCGLLSMTLNYRSNFNITNRPIWKHEVP